MLWLDRVSKEHQDKGKQSTYFICPGRVFRMEMEFDTRHKLCMAYLWTIFNTHKEFYVDKCGAMKR